jgi:hypothetical protein
MGRESRDRPPPPPPLPLSSCVSRATCAPTHRTPPSPNIAPDDATPSDATPPRTASLPNAPRAGSSLLRDRGTSCGVRCVPAWPGHEHDAPPPPSSRSPAAAHAASTAPARTERVASPGDPRAAARTHRHMHRGQEAIGAREQEREREMRALSRAVGRVIERCAAQRWNARVAVAQRSLRPQRVRVEGYSQVRVHPRASSPPISATHVLVSSQLLV